MKHDGFRPAWWLPGPHAQTLGARWLRSRQGEKALRRERVQLPDGDFLDLDFSDVDPRLPLVVVLHGLEGSARSTYALEMYRALRARDIQAVGLNFRSCSGELNRAPRLYHSGETADLAFILEVLGRRFPKRLMGAVGFSLGGNVLLKYLGEAGGVRGAAAAAEAAEDPGGFALLPLLPLLPPLPPLRAAAAISVPFDLGAGARHLERGFSRAYRRYLVRKLQRKTRGKAALLRDRISVQRVLAARTFVEFDDAATAPLHGFRDAQDYYARSSCAPYLGAIRVPTLLVHSADDPFLPAEAIPRAAVGANPMLRAEFTEAGGHVGFVSGPPWSPVFWAEQRAAGFLAHYLHGEM